MLIRDTHYITDIILLASASTSHTVVFQYTYIDPTSHIYGRQAMVTKDVSDVSRSSPCEDTTRDTNNEQVT